jgi:hypothetical protein
MTTYREPSVEEITRRAYGLYLERGVTTDMTLTIGLKRKKSWAILSRGKQERKRRQQLVTHQAKSILVNINPAGGTVAIETATAAWVAIKNSNSMHGGRARPLCYSKWRASSSDVKVMSRDPL